MNDREIPQWLKWAQELQAMSQTGLTYSQDQYNNQRYSRLAEIAAEIVARHTGLTVPELVSDFRCQPGYATPKVDVRGAITRDGQILLVQERSDQQWCLPGGWADVGESSLEMVVREVHEESGFEVEATKLIGVWDANRSGKPLSFYHAYKIIFLCVIKGGSARLSEETMDVDFFDFDRHPPLSEQRTHPRHLNEIELHLENPLRPAFFE